MTHTSYTLRPAHMGDVPELQDLIARSTRELGAEHYTEEEIEGALRGTFGVDTQLIHDGTYFVAEYEGTIVGCGGWSFRAKMLGGDGKHVEEPDELDPETQPARIRAFFVDPKHARKGVGRMLLVRCELEARTARFHRVQMTTSLSAAHLYTSCGYVAEPPRDYEIGNELTIRLVPMSKELHDHEALREERADA